MTGLPALGKQLIFLGLVVSAVGLILVLFGRLPLLRFGKLPGDIHIERDGWQIFFPIGTSILLSVIISFILWLIGRSSR